MALTGLSGGGSGGTGTTTSVGLSLPVDFTVTGSPVTTAGTLTATRAVQGANTIMAGPTTGANDVPTYRALVLADIPAGVALTGSSNTFTALQVINVASGNILAGQLAGVSKFAFDSTGTLTSGGVNADLIVSQGGTKFVPTSALSGIPVTALTTGGAVDGSAPLSNGAGVVGWTGPASSSVFGAVKVDNTTMTAAAGVLSVGSIAGSAIGSGTVVAARLGAHGTNHGVGGSDPVYYDRGHCQFGTAFFDTIPAFAAINQQVIAVGQLFLAYFTAPASATVSKIGFCSTATAFSGNTHCYLLLYSVAANGDITLVARSADDTTILTGGDISAVFSRAIGFDNGGGAIANYTLVEGTRYAIGIHGIGGSGAPNLASTNGFTVPLTGFNGALYAGKSGTGQTSLITSLAHGSISNPGSQAFWAFVQ